MTLTIFDAFDQGTDEWHDARRGILTASAVGRLIAIGAPDAVTVDCPTCNATANAPCLSAARKTPTPIKTIHDARAQAVVNLPPVYTVADNDTARGLVATLAAERITGWTDETPMNSDMWRGVEAEPIAREAYARQQEVAVTEVGFILRTEHAWQLGYSPDGLVGDDGLIEIKAPRTKTHLQTVIADEVPAHYMAQLQAGLMVTGREWIDFISYVAGMPLFIKRVLPDANWLAALEAAATAFEVACNDLVTAYEARVKGLPMTDRNAMELVI